MANQLLHAAFPIKLSCFCIFNTKHGFLYLPFTEPWYSVWGKALWSDNAAAVGSRRRVQMQELNNASSRCQPYFTELALRPTQSKVHWISCRHNHGIRLIPMGLHSSCCSARTVTDCSPDGAALHLLWLSKSD